MAERSLCGMHLFLLLEVFERNKQHPEAFAFFFAKVLVVHFVCPAYGARISVVDVAEQLKTLVDEDVVHDKIGKAVAKNTDPDGDPNFKHIKPPQQEKPDTDHGIHYKEKVIAFKPRVVVLAVMVLVP